MGDAAAPPKRVKHESVAAPHAHHGFVSRRCIPCGVPHRLFPAAVLQGVQCLSGKEGEGGSNDADA